MKIIDNIIKEWEKFINAREQIKELKKDRNFWRKHAHILLNKTSDEKRKSWSDIQQTLDKINSMSTTNNKRK